MKRVRLILNTVALTVMFLSSCNNKEGCTDPSAINYDASAEEDDGSCTFSDPNTDPHPTNGTVTDQDGNTYSTVIIGTQEWMAENLRTTKYANGDPIPNISNNTQWQELTTGAWAYYNNESQYENPYGKLYNWYSVADSRNVCPIGWHVPTHAEWNTLIAYLDPSFDPNLLLDVPTSDIGGKMKSVGTQYWESPNQDATNESGFSGLPGGSRGNNGDFFSMGRLGNWWSSTEAFPFYAWNRYLDYSSSDVKGFNYGMRSAFSVRCIKD